MLIIGFLFIIWIIIGASVAVAHLLAKWSRRSSQRQLRDLPPVPKRAITILAIVLSVYGTVAFIGYIYWCESVRHVDIGFGDTWAAHVENDYYFCMAESTDDGELIFRGDGYIYNGNYYHFGIYHNDNKWRLLWVNDGNGATATIRRHREIASPYISRARSSQAAI
jgi:hypothetical protein